MRRFSDGSHTLFYVSRLLMILMWIHAHVPHSLSEVVGNPEAFTEIRLWANAWKQGQIQKPLLLVGPPGVGKTLSAYVLAEEFGWSLVEFNASDVRDKETIEKVVSAAALNASFTGAPRLVLLDEIDGIQGSQDKGGLSAILTVLKEAQNPVILTANDIYGDKRLAGVRAFCKLIQFRKVAYPSIGKFLKDVGEKEGIDYDALSIGELAKNSAGDVRAALMDFESLARANKKITLEDVQSIGYRERQENIFNVMRTLFVSNSLVEIRRARSAVEVDHDLLKKWVDENIPRQFPMADSLASAYDALSRGDMFDGRIFRRQHYGFLKYSGDLVAGVGLRTNERAHGWISYQFPGILKRLSAAKGSGKKEAIAKIQSQEFGSRSRIAQELVFWSAFLSGERAAEWVHSFEFDEDDLAFLLQTSSTSVKVKKLLEKAEALKTPVRAKHSAVISEPAVESASKRARKKDVGENAPALVAEKSGVATSAPEDVKNQTSLSRFF